MDTNADHGNGPEPDERNGRSTPRAMRRLGWIRFGLALAVVAVVVVVSVDALDAWEQALRSAVDDMRLDTGLLIAVTLVYAVCLAVPFVPGMEIGVLMMVVFGRPGVVMAYVGTLLGLNLAFAAGRLLRDRMVDSEVLRNYRERAANPGAFGLRRVGGRGRLRSIVERVADSRSGLRDYVVVALLLNVPGNVLIGGGGAIGLISGLSGRVRWAGFAVTVALATVAVPLLAFFGMIRIERMAG